MALTITSEYELELLYGIVGLFFVLFTGFVTLIDRSDGAIQRRVAGCTASIAMLTLTFFYLAMFFRLRSGNTSLESFQDTELILRIVVSCIVFGAIFACVAVCLQHHWMTTLQIIVLVTLAWLFLLTHQLGGEEAGSGVFFYLIHVVTLIVALQKLMSYTHTHTKDAQLSKVLVLLSVVIYAMIWAFIVPSSSVPLKNEPLHRAVVFAALDVTLIPILFVQHLYLPLRAYRRPSTATPPI